MRVFVSIHDVSPAWTEEIELALNWCQHYGIQPALLVVPNFHGVWPLDTHPAFVQRLRELQAAGCPLLLHGLYHQSRIEPQPLAPGEYLKWVLAQRVVSNGEAEFGELTPEEAERRLDLGEQEFAKHQLRLDGFVAPAWITPSWLLPILSRRGYRYTEDHFHIYDPQGNRQRRSLVLNYASRDPSRLLSSVAMCRAARPLAKLLPTRIAIHPGDMRFELLRTEIGALLAWAQGHTVPKGSDLFV